MTERVIDGAPRPREHGEGLLTPEEVAHRLRVSRPTVYAWLKIGRLRGLRAGKGWRVRSEDLEAFLQPGAAATREAGQPAPRRYSREEILEFLEADRLDPETLHRIECALSE
jgi:excisionase family DNA binding protein